ncbi:MAG: hypothetical protein ACOH15_03285 [Acetobacterium sp.]
MKHALIINLSPRKKGTSVMLAKRCQDFLNESDDQAKIINLYPNLKDMSPILKGINQADTIMMVGPCYVNCFPADTINLLEQIIKNKEILHGQNLYGIIQGGMPYSHTHESGLKMLELFSRECNITYRGGFVLGLGAMLNGQPLEKLPNGKKVQRLFNIFLNNCANGKDSPPELYQKAQIKMPGLAYRYMTKAANKRTDKECQEKSRGNTELSPYFDIEG